MPTPAQKSKTSLGILAAKCVDPFRQGNLDGLCGLYAAINAITIARWPYRPVDRIEVSRLFEAGLRHIDLTGDLIETAVEGMDWQMLRCLTSTLAVQASSRSLRMVVDRLPYSAPPTKRRDALRHCISQQWPVIVNIEDRSHYSVIVGAAPTRYYLADSSGACWISHVGTKLTHALSIKCRPNPSIR